MSSQTEEKGWVDFALTRVTRVQLKPTPLIVVLKTPGHGFAGVVAGKGVDAPRTR